MEIIAQYGHIFLIMACVFGFFMAWGIGANDVANAMGTSVGSRALTIKQAILIAMVFEFLGAYLAGLFFEDSVAHPNLMRVVNDRAYGIAYSLTADWRCPTGAANS